MRLTPRRPARLLAVLAGLGASGCATSQAACFPPGVVLPDPGLVGPALSTGDAGREAYDAVQRGDREAVRALLGADPGLAETAVPPPPSPAAAPDGQYGDLLTFAVATCDPLMVETLLDAGLAPDGALPGVALSLAVTGDDPSLAATLLEAGASPDPQKRGGVNVLHEAAALRSLDDARLLVAHGLDLRWADQFGRTHLDDAVTLEAFEVAEVLVEAGASPWTIDRDGHMPVHVILGPSFLPDAAQEAAQGRLREAVRRPGLPWPPPDPAVVRARVAAGEWPTPAMRTAGMEVSPQALDGIRAREAGTR